MQNVYEHFWASWYYVPAIIIAIAGLMFAVLGGAFYLMNKADGYNARHEARFCLGALCVMLLSFLWPVILPIAVVVFLVYVIRDAK